MHGIGPQPKICPCLLICSSHYIHFPIWYWYSAIQLRFVSELLQNRQFLYALKSVFVFHSIFTCSTLIRTKTQVAQDQKGLRGLKCLKNKLKCIFWNKVLQFWVKSSITHP